MSADSRSDNELLAAYRAGESPALGELVRRHHDDLMRFLTRLCGDRTLAEDAFQEAFLQVHISSETFDQSRRFKPWLFTIAANKARDLLRRSARRRTLDLSAPVSGARSDGSGEATTYVDLMEAAGSSPGASVSARERDAMVQRTVQDMPPTLREVLMLAYFGRMSYSQVADALDIPLGTVKSRLHAAVAAFAKRWQAVTKSSHRAGGTEAAQ